MESDADIWDEVGTLTLTHEERGGLSLPPRYQPDDRSGPLREILGAFLTAAPKVQARFSLVMENGQAFSAHDIAELMLRPDCPVP